MKLSENTMKWVMRFYPPLFFQRIWVKRFHPGFTGIDVVVYKSLLNRNYNTSIFGGTLFSAVDPFIPILFDQYLKQKGFRTLIWLKSGSVSYLKPARSNMRFTIQLSEQQFKQAQQALLTTGKFIETYQVVLYDEDNIACAMLDQEVYVRNVSLGENRKKIDS